MANNSIGDVMSLIPVKSVERDHLVYQNNTYGMVIKVNSINLFLMTPEDVQLTVGRLAGVLKGINKQCSIVKLERPTDYSKNIAYTDRLLRVQHSKLQNKETTEDGYNTRLGLVLNDKAVLESYNSENKIFKNDFYIVIYNNTIEELLSITSTAMGGLTALKLDPELCKRDALIKFLHDFYNPSKALSLSECSKLETNEDILKAVAPDSVEFSATSLKLNGMDTKMMSVHKYPLNVSEGWLVDMFAIPSSSCVMNLKPVPTAEAKSLMDKAITEVKTQFEGRNKASESITMQTQMETFLNVLQDIERGDESLKLTTISIMVYGNNQKEMQENVKVAINTARQVSLKMDKLTCRQIEGFITMSPTPKDMIVDTLGRDIPCSTLGASFPFVFQTLNDDNGFLLGHNSNSLIFFDTKVRSSSRTNSNMMVIGKSGSGKSFFTKKMITKEILSGTKCFIVDPEGEYDVITKNLGGQSIDVGGAVQGRINPFHIFTEMEDDFEGAAQAQFSLQIQFLESFFQQLIPDMTDFEVTVLSGLLIKTYNQKDIYESTNVDKFVAEQFPIIDDLVRIMDEEIRIESQHASEKLEALKHLRVYFTRFCSGGALSTMWNGHTAIDTGNCDLLHFDFKRMLNQKNDRIMNTQMMLVLKYLQSEVTKNREYNLKHNTHRHVAIYVDEAHVFIDEKSPAALHFMYQMVKRIRKYNGIFVVITQNVNDFVGSPAIKKQTTAIINGCQYSFIFGLNPADLQSLVDLYASVGGFSKEERNFIGSAGVGQCLFIVSPGNRIIMQKIMVDDVEAEAFKPKNERKL